MSLDHLRVALDAAGRTQAVLSHPETPASLGCFETPHEGNTDYTSYCLAPRAVLAPYARV